MFQMVEPQSVSANTTRKKTRNVAKICIFSRLNQPGLGDMLQRNIIINIIQEAHPEAELYLIAGESLIKRFQELYQNHSAITGFVAAPDIGDRSIVHWLQFGRKLRSHRFDLCVIDFDNHGPSAFHAYLCGIPERVGFAQGRRSDTFLTRVVRFEPGKVARPDLFHFAVAYARALGITRQFKPQEIVPRFRFQPEQLPEVHAPRPIVAVHVGGAQHWNRRWPLERYQQICTRLCGELGATVFLVGGPDDKSDNLALQRSVVAAVPQSHIYDVSGTTLNHSANYLAAADLFVGNDSGPMHLAAALRVPTTTLYGPSGTAFFWANVYPNHICISKWYDCQKISHFAENWSNFPCAYACPYAYDPAVRQYPRCLTDITVDEVWSVIKKSLHTLAAKQQMPL